MRRKNKHSVAGISMPQVLAEFYVPRYLDNLTAEAKVAVDGDVV